MNKFLPVCFDNFIPHLEEPIFLNFSTDLGKVISRSLTYTLTGWKNLCSGKDDYLMLLPFSVDHFP